MLRCDERVCAICVFRAQGRVKVLFVLADTPAFLTFVHIPRSHSYIALQWHGLEMQQLRISSERHEKETKA